MASTMRPDPTTTASPTGVITAIHKLSHRLTPTITWHCFELKPPGRSDPASTNPFSWRPGQSLEIQLPPDIDLTNNKLDAASRTLQFTPCSWYPSGQSPAESEAALEFISRNGRLSSLISTPRFTELCASVSLVPGSLDLNRFLCSNDDCGPSIAIAGGTGIAPFLSLSTSSMSDSSENRALIWSLHVDDLPLAKYTLTRGYLSLAKWNYILIFLTTGPDGDLTPWRKELIRSKGDDISAASSSPFPSSSASTRIRFFIAQRVTLQNLKDLGTELDNREASAVKNKGRRPTIFFCGSKAFQWQVRSWGLALEWEFFGVVNVDASGPRS